jgi:hypothetical protein
MNWEKLIESKEVILRRGGFLKFDAGEAFEKKVVMMICEACGDPFKKGLITITGHKAGINHYVVFPQTDGVILRDWLIDNWNEWVWPDGDVSNVLFCSRLDASDL